MARSKGINAHKVFKLGKAAASRDPRNLKFAAVLKAQPALPAAYDFDTQHTGIPTPMFANDTYGCCVISGRAHQTLRFEEIEQGAVVMISDTEVTREYLKETGGVDSGLIVLDSLKLWRKRGWRAAKKTLKIRAFSEVNFKDRDEVRRAIYADVGIGLGVQLPVAAQGQFQTGQPWGVTKGKGSQPSSWGGHYVYVCGYTPDGPVCVTWGRKQQMTWDWLDKYADEAYAVFDADNNFKKAQISSKAIGAFLAEL